MNKKCKEKKHLKEPVENPLENVWLKARSKNLTEKQEALDSLSLLFVLFEYTLDIKAEESCDPLEDIENSLLIPEGKKKKLPKPLPTLEVFEKPFVLPGRKVMPDVQLTAQACEVIACPTT